MAVDERQASRNVRHLVAAVKRCTNNRKRRLFCAACARSVLHLWPDAAREATIAVGEAYADDPTDGLLRKRRGSAWNDLMAQLTQRQAGLLEVLPWWWPSGPGNWPIDLHYQLTRGAWAALTRDILAAVVASSRVVANRLALHAPEKSASETFTAAWDKKLVELANLWRHLLGNPFAAKARLPHIPKLVRNLAESAYHQDAGAIAPLHDALLEADLTTLANHFQDTRVWHPKGCWAIDLLTART